jgi:hypothetical protein
LNSFDHDTFKLQRDLRIRVRAASVT